MRESAGIRRKSLHLFDLDETLLVTRARILVRDGSGGVSRELSTGEFSGYRLREGESLDFSQFADVGILSRGIVVKYTRGIIENILRHGTRSQFGILTARPHKQGHAAFLCRFFRDLFGIRLRKELIFTVSDRRFMLYKDRFRPFSDLPVAERKAVVVAEDLIRRGFNDISFYDDSRENIESFKRLAGLFPEVRFRGHFIDPTWSARLREFLESGRERKRLIKGHVSARLILEHHGEAGADAAALLGRIQGGEACRLRGWALALAREGQAYYLVRC